MPNEKTNTNTKPPTMPGDIPPPAPPPDLPPVIAVSSQEKPKTKFKNRFKGKKMIPAILGVLFLVGGVAAGLILVRQQQDIRERAAPPPDEESCKGCAQNLYMWKWVNGRCKKVYSEDCRISRGTPPPGTPLCTGYGAASCVDKQPGASCGEGGECVMTNPNNGACSCQGQQPPPEKRVCNEASDLECVGKRPGSACGNEGTCDLTDSQKYTCACEELQQPTEPPPGSISAQCLEIKVFDFNWQRITNFSVLEPGDTIRFTVAGNTSSGKIDMARFTVNGVQLPAVTQKRPGTDEFYVDYNLSIGVTDFTVRAELHHTEIGWF